MNIPTAFSAVSLVNGFADGWAAVIFRASWQCGGAIALVWLICAIAPSIPPRVRCWLWRLAAAKLILGLLWFSPIPLPILPQQRGTISTTSTISNSNSEAVPATPEPRELAPIPSATPNVSVNLPITIPAMPQAAEPRHWSLALLLLWIFGIAFTIRRLTINWRQARRLRENSTEIRDEIVLNAVHRLCNRMGIAKPPAIAVSPEIIGPVLIGFFRPAILLPASWSDRTRENFRDMGIAHELAHLARRDLLWSWLNAIVGVLFFFHPLVWLLQRESSMAADAACDVEALHATDFNRHSYMQLLVDLAAKHAGLRTGGFAMLGMIETIGTLRKRLRDLSNARKTSRRAMVLAGILISVIALPGLISWRLVRRASADAPATRTDEQRTDEARRAILARFDELQNFSAQYHDDQTSMYTAMVKMMQAAGQPTNNLPANIVDQALEFDKQFDFLGGLIKTQYRQTAGPNNGIVGMMYVFTPSHDHDETLTYHAKSAPSGAILPQPSQPFVIAPDIDSYLGLRDIGFSFEPVMTRNRLAQFKMTFPNEDDVVLGENDERRGTTQWTFSRQHGFALIKFVLLCINGNDERMQADDFRQVGDLILPFKFTLELYTTDTGADLVTQRFVATVHQYVVGSKDNVAANYNIDWPPDARVLDFRSGSPVWIQNRPAPRGNNRGAPATQPAN